MPKLSEFLSGVLDSLSEARVASDIRSSQLAQEYGEDALLKSYSVPRMRISNVEVDAPVAVNTIKEKSLVKQNVDLDEAQEVLYDILCTEFKLSTTDLSTLETDGLDKTIKSAIDDKLKAVKSTITTSTAINDIAALAVAISEDFKNAADSKISSISSINIDNVSASVLHSLEDVFLSKKVSDLDVFVESSKLKDLSANSLIRIKVNIIEEGMEWAISQDKEGNINSKLIPE